MQTNLEELREHVAGLSDEALLEVKPEDLVESARGVYEAEIASRGLQWTAAAMEEQQQMEAEADTGLVSIAKFESVEEARFARTMLENEGIPVWFVGELTPNRVTGDPLAGLELVTKADYVEQAQLVLNTEVSEEELARQAEEAGQLLAEEEAAAAAAAEAEAGSEEEEATEEQEETR
jgi:hypothetical protein